jgi:hypothetical protein
MSHSKVFELLTDIRNEFGKVVPASTARGDRRCGRRRAAEHQQTAANAVAVPYGLAPNGPNGDLGDLGKRRGASPLARAGSSDIVPRGSSPRSSSFLLGFAVHGRRRGVFDLDPIVAAP